MPPDGISGPADPELPPARFHLIRLNVRRPFEKSGGNLGAAALNEERDYEEEHKADDYDIHPPLSRLAFTLSPLTGSPLAAAANPSSRGSSPSGNRFGLRRDGCVSHCC